MIHDTQILLPCIFGAAPGCLHWVSVTMGKFGVYGPGVDQATHEMRRKGFVLMTVATPEPLVSTCGPVILASVCRHCMEAQGLKWTSDEEMAAMLAASPPPAEPSPTTPLIRGCPEHQEFTQDCQSCGLLDGVQSLGLLSKKLAETGRQNREAVVVAAALATTMADLMDLDDGPTAVQLFLRTVTAGVAHAARQAESEPR